MTSATQAFLQQFPATAQLCLDSRQVNPGDIFIARQGGTYDGRLFLGMAQSRGAAGFIIEGKPGQVALQHRPTLYLPDLNHELLDLAAHFYGYPAKRMQLYGVTGTNGKTSITHYISALNQAVSQKHCAVMGTLGFGLPGHYQSYGLTTPDVVSLQRYFKTLLDQAISSLAMEVSSHGLDQGRVAGCQFEATIFTNLTQDHLDYHGTLEHYWAAKKTLFTDYESKTLIINGDDPYGQTLIIDLTTGKLKPKLNEAKIYVYGLKSELTKLAQKYPNLSLVTLDNIHRTLEKTHAHCRSPWGEGTIETPLLGDFNLSNLLAAISTLGSQGADFQDILQNVPACQAVPGRMRRFGGSRKKPLVVVDYAHTPDALEKILAALRPYCQGKLHCVFGCGGERDRLKRPLMLQAVLKGADQVWITQDNSRNEPPEQIIADMLTGNTEGRSLHIELDRETAIQQAIRQATSQDIVLIAGKGHETVQLLGLEQKPFNDETAVQAFLEKF